MCKIDDWNICQKRWSERCTPLEVTKTKKNFKYDNLIPSGFFIKQISVVSSPIFLSKLNSNFVSIDFELKILNFLLW